MTFAQRFWCGSCAALFSFLISGPAICAALFDGPPTDAICVPDGHGGLIVDKEKLAAYWLGKSPFNVGVVPANDFTSSDGTRVHAAILSDTAICANNSACSPTDKSDLATVRGETIVLLGGQLKGYAAATTVDQALNKEPLAFFEGPDQANEVRCVEQIAAPPKAAPQGPAPSQSTENDTGNGPDKDSSVGLLDRVRVRGSADQLEYDRTSSQFQAATAATASYLRDQVAKNATTKVVGDVGFAIVDTAPLEGALGYKVIPFVGTNVSEAEPLEGKAKPPTTETYDVGTAFSAFRVFGGLNPVGVLISTTPDYLWDYSDHSQLLTLDTRVQPFVNGRVSPIPFAINDFLFAGAADQPALAIEPMLDGRLDIGSYESVGTNSIALRDRNFTRLGGQMGITLQVLNPSIPITATSTYTGLLALTGPIHVGYWANSVTWSLGAKKYVGVTLSYDSGVLETTAKRQDQTSVALSVKY